MPEKTTKNSSFEDIFLAIVSIFCFYGFILGVLYLFNFDIIFNSFEILNQIVLLLVVICCVLYFEIIKNHKTFLGFIGFRKEDIKTYIVATLAGFVLVVLAVGFLDYLSSLFSSSETNPYEGADKKLFDSVFVLSLLISPFSEEFFFRGFLQDILVEKLGAVWGIVITVLSFSLLHQGYWNYWGAFLGIITIAIVLSLLKYKTNSLIPSIVVHLLNNFLVLTLLLN